MALRLGNARGATRRQAGPPSLGCLFHLTLPLHCGDGVPPACISWGEELQWQQQATLTSGWLKSENKRLLAKRKRCRWLNARPQKKCRGHTSICEASDTHRDPTLCCREKASVATSIGRMLYRPWQTKSHQQQAGPMFVGCFVGLISLLSSKVGYKRSKQIFLNQTIKQYVTSS